VGLIAFGWKKGQGGLGMAKIRGKFSPCWESNLIRAVDRDLLHYLNDLSSSLTKDFTLRYTLEK
jgi:hypothetical protein